jgi:superkiller protein 3
MSNVSGPHSKELKKRLASAREALAAGDGAGARCLTREALALDDTSYDAWVFDGKASFFCGDVQNALKSYKVAAEIRDDHPAARRGAVEAAERLVEQSSLDSSSPSESVAESTRVLADALREALRLPADEKQLTPARRVLWTEALAKACEASGNHAEARERWTCLVTRARGSETCENVNINVDALPEKSTRSLESLAIPEPSVVARALEGAARCALAEEEASSRAEEDRAEQAVRSTTIASPADVRAARADAAKKQAAKKNPALERAVRALLDAEACATTENPLGAALLARGARAFDATLDAAMARRAAARLDLAAGADAAGAAALETLDELERLLARHGGEPEARRLARDAALEAAAALDAGWDVEEEGWEETRAFDEESVALTRRALAVLRACDHVSRASAASATSASSETAVPETSETDEPEGDPTADPAATVARVWCRLADPGGRGRSGRAANAPGSRAAALAFPPRAREALVAALRRDDAVVAGGRERENRAATTASATSPGASLLGWGAAAEAAAAADRPGEALDAARAGLKSLKALRERERASVDGDGDPDAAPRAQAAERRLRVVSAEALCSLGRLAEARAAFRAIAPPSPRTTRGLAASSDAREALTLLKSAASAFGPAAPRPLAELGWAMLKAGGEGAASRARRALERACELVAASEADDVAAGAPPDIAARLGIARWREAVEAGDSSARATARGPGSPRAALLAAAAEEGPWRASAFAHLALVYAASGDETRAAKCRARALLLDPADPTAGPAACDAAKDDERETEQICAAALAASSRCAWAAVRLAPIAARRGDHEAAAAALRTTLRAAAADAPETAAAWEALGASYDAMDKHSAALKAYRAATDLDERNKKTKIRVFASTRSGSLAETLGDLNAAVAAHAAALAAAPGHPAAALGLAEAETARAKEAARVGALARAAGAAARAAAAAELARAAPNAPIRAAAKRAGDAYLVAARLGVGHIGGSATSGALGASASACLAARRAYARGVLATPHRAAAWFDLAAACVARAELDAEDGELRDEASDAFQTNASACLRASLKLDPADPNAWVALGTLPAARADDATKRASTRRDRARRETALARATVLDPSCAPAWAALGRLYVTAALDSDSSNEETRSPSPTVSSMDDDDEKQNATSAGNASVLSIKTFWLRRASAALDRARAADPGSKEAWLATAMLHAANLDPAEAAGAARAAADAGNAAEAHRARALWGLSSLVGKSAFPSSAAYLSTNASYASARRAREASRPDAVAALALGLCAEARGRDAEAHAAFEAASLLAESWNARGTKNAGNEMAFASAVEAEARRGAARVEPSKALPVAPRAVSKPLEKGGFLDTEGVREATAVAIADVHARPWDVLKRAELASLLSASETSRLKSFCASRVVPEAHAAQIARASEVSSAESTTNAAVAAAAAALAATPAGAGASAEADARAIGIRLARAILEHPACASATRARALLALVAARRAGAGELFGASKRRRSRLQSAPRLCARRSRALSPTRGPTRAWRRRSCVPPRRRARLRETRSSRRRSPRRRPRRRRAPTTPRGGSRTRRRDALAPSRTTHNSRACWTSRCSTRRARLSFPRRASSPRRRRSPRATRAARSCPARGNARARVFRRAGGRDDGDGDDGARLARRDARREKRAEGGKGSRQDPRQGDARRGGGRRGGARRNGGVRARRARDGDGG